MFNVSRSRFVLYLEGRFDLFCVGRSTPNLDTVLSVLVCTIAPICITPERDLNIVGVMLDS